VAQASDFSLPVPGVMVNLSPEFNPPILKGIKIHPDNPFRFDFILDKGDSSVIARNAVTKQSQQEQLKQESTKLIKYFLASLTIPEKDLWVNLSPYEKDRIIPQSFGLTEMGRDLLAEDYMLKQITASLIYPEGDTGKKFWKRIYQEVSQKFGTTNIPVNTFNKVWIVPDKAVVYENAKAGTAYVVESTLKVMLEEDYLSLEKHSVIASERSERSNLLKSKKIASSALPPRNDTIDVNTLGSQILRQIVIPELTKEVNEGKNFAQLRQVYNSLILATWYKKKIKDSILEQVYADKNKVAGVNIDDPQEKERIYQRYLQAFKKGVFNYIKDSEIPNGVSDTTLAQSVPRKYFSGGVNETDIGSSKVYQSISYVPSFAMIIPDHAMRVTVDIEQSSRRDSAMSALTWLKQLIDSVSAESSNEGKFAFQMSRREFLKKVGQAAAIAGVELSGVGPALESLPEIVNLSKLEYGDLFFATFTPDRFNFIASFYNSQLKALVNRYSKNPIGGAVSHGVNAPSVLAWAWDYAPQNDELFERLPNAEELESISNFLNKNQGNAFERFFQNSGVRALALQEYRNGFENEHHLDKSIDIPAPSEEDLNELIREIFRQNRDMFRIAAQVIQRLPEIESGIQEDPANSLFCDVFKSYFVEGRKALEESDLFMKFLNDYWRPKRELLKELNETYRAGSSTGEIEKSLDDLDTKWQEELDKLVEEHKESKSIAVYPLDQLVAQRSSKGPLRLYVSRLNNGQVKCFILQNGENGISLGQGDIQKILRLIPKEELKPGGYIKIIFEHPISCG